MSEKIVKVFGPLENVDRKSFMILAKAIAKNNLPGFDYLEFKESVRNLLDMNMDSSVAFKSAFTTGATVGLTLEKLIASASHYEEVLKSEKRQFKNALQNQIEAKILTREKEKEKLAKKIETLEKQIAALEQEKLITERRLENFDSEVEQVKKKIKNASLNFNGAIDHLVEQINEDIQNIRTFLS